MNFIPLIVSSFALLLFPSLRPSSSPLSSFGSAKVETFFYMAILPSKKIYFFSNIFSGFPVSVYSSGRCIKNFFFTFRYLPQEAPPVCSKPAGGFVFFTTRTAATATYMYMYSIPPPVISRPDKNTAICLFREDLAQWRPSIHSPLTNPCLP